MSKVLVIRYGAFGDGIILTPVLRELKKQGHYIYMNTNERGIQIYKNNPNIDQIVPYIDGTFNYDQMEKFWPELANELGVDKTINFTQTIEVALAVHPATDEYYEHPDKIREQCNKNYYEYSAQFAQVTCDSYKPEMFFEEKEELEARKYIDANKFNIVWCIKGSGIHKYYPWVSFIINELYNNYPLLNVITVGDNDSLSVEDEILQATKLCGKVPFRTSALLTKISNLVVSTDTGLLHAAGCWDTPKIAILGATSKENITKHFDNCYTFEAGVTCSPCFQMIYEYDKQGCPVDELTGSVACMGGGVDPKEIYELIVSKYNEWYKFKNNGLLGGLLNGY